MDHKFYKHCVVPQCESSTIKTPNKLFIYVPRKKHLRKKWLQLARRNVNVASHSKMHFCEDHFDLPNDMENYMEYHVMGFVGQVRMKPGTLPRKFECQQDRRKRTGSKERPYAVKKQRRMIIDECLSESVESGFSTSSIQETSFTSLDLHIEEHLQEAKKTENKSIHRLSDDTSRVSPVMEAYVDGQTENKTQPSKQFFVKDISKIKVEDAIETNPVPDVNLKICRICLSTDNKMFSMTCFNLNEAYEALTGISADDEEQLPQYLCRDCADRLMNCARFRRRSLRAHSVLMDVYKNHGRITVELVENAKEIYYTMDTDAEDKINNDNMDFDKDLEKVNKVRDIQRDHTYVNNEFRPEIYEEIDNQCVDIKTEINVDEDREETDVFKDQIVDACFSDSEIGISAQNNEYPDDVCVNFELKTEIDEINEDVINEVFSKKEMYTTCSEDTVSVDMADEVGIKIELLSSDCMEYIPSDMSAGEDVFDDPLSTQVEQEVRNDQQSPEADGGIITDNMFSCDICRYQTDCRSKLDCHKRNHLRPLPRILRAAGRQRPRRGSGKILCV